MKLVWYILILMIPLAAFGQQEDGAQKSTKQKWVKFESIIDAHIGWQAGNTRQIFAGGSNTADSTLSNYKSPKLGVDLSLGGSLREILFAGIGAGYDRQFAGNGRAQQDNAKVFGHIRIHLFRAKLRPMLGIKAGYQYRQLANSVTEVTADKLRFDGVFFAPELGVSVKMGGHLLLNLALVYEYKRLADRFDTVWSDISGNTIEETGSFLKHQDHYINLVLGFTIH